MYGGFETMTSYRFSAPSSVRSANAENMSLRRRVKSTAAFLRCTSIRGPGFIRVDVATMVSAADTALGVVVAAVSASVINSRSAFCRAMASAASEISTAVVSRKAPNFVRAMAIQPEPVQTSRSDAPSLSTCERKSGHLSTVLTVADASTVGFSTSVRCAHAGTAPDGAAQMDVICSGMRFPSTASTRVSVSARGQRTSFVTTKSSP